MEKSVVQFFPELEHSKCGYCKRTNCSLSQGMWAYSLTVQDYQDLIDRGWRRSGKYCYKPVMDSTCCPMFTIRCNALEFKVSKSQKKVLKRFNKFLTCGSNLSSEPNQRRMSTTCSDEPDERLDESVVRDMFVSPAKQHQNINLKNVQEKMFDNSKSNDEKNTEHGLGNQTQFSNQTHSGVNQNNTEVKKGLGGDPHKTPCKKAKQLRYERKLKKLNANNSANPILIKKNKNNIKQVEDFLNEIPDETKSKIEIKLVCTNPPSPEWLSTVNETHSLYVKYQTSIHNDKPQKCTMSQFVNFLVDSPLLPVIDEESSQCRYGSFHQQYWLEGKLIAVGVLDILPKCVSSVYFFYDPKYMELSLGTFGALREIAFTRQLNTEIPELKYYYMGYYIHSCPKMRYKGKYHPSYLLCPETYKWFPIDTCLPMLDSSPYSRLNPNLDDLDTNSPKENDIDDLPIFNNGRPVLLKHLIDNKDFDKELLRKYMQIVGVPTAKRIILVIK